MARIKTFSGNIESPINYYFVPGRALGLTIGSLLVAAYGLRFAYLTLGILAAGTSFFYLIAYHSVLKKMEKKRLEQSSTKEGSFHFLSEKFNI